MIRVIGVGGGGSNAVNRMIRAEMMGVEFIACNTDAQALLQSDAPHKIRIGDKVTRGLGAGGDAAMGQRSAEEDSDKIASALADSDMVFITAGLGGGTGSGAAPIVAQIAKDSGALTIGVVTKPFAFEGNRRKLVAEKAAEELKAQVDALITIPNDRLKDVVQKNTSILDAFRVVDDVLRQGVQGISDIITMPGLINQDFADVRAIMKDAGSALMGIGRATGENRAVEAAQQAIAEPLLELDIHGAQGILWNITGSSTLSLFEVNEAAETIKEAADPGQHHLRHELQRAPRRRGHGHGHRDRLRRWQAPAERPARGDWGHGGAAATRVAHERDFLQELERQREQGSDGIFIPSTRDDDQIPVSAPRVDRAAGEPAARKPVTYDADDLEIELPAPQVTRAGGRPATIDDGSTSPGRRPPGCPRARTPADRCGVRPGRTRTELGDPRRGLEDRRGRAAARRRPGRHHDPWREPRPGGRGQGRGPDGRDLAPRRTAPVEQGPAGDRDVRRHPGGRLDRAGRAARSPRPRAPRAGPGGATRCSSRSTWTTIRPRPAWRPATFPASSKP